MNPIKRYYRHVGAGLPAFSALLPWTGLAFKTGEMLAASAVVINQRVARMAMAGNNPSARDRREFHRMGQEKIDAGVSSMAAVAMQAALIGPQAGAFALRHWMNAMSSIAAQAAQPSHAIVKVQAAISKNAVSGAAGMASHTSAAMAKLAQHGLDPVHSRATANARRLLKG